MLEVNDSLEMTGLRRRYLDGALAVRDVVTALLDRIEARGDDGVWIERVDAAELLVRARALEAADARRLPLYGIPFAVKDNIDLAGLPTTAACPEFSYRPERSAPVVERLLSAGAIALGKTNLDQFATGLVGTRSPYGPCRNAFDPHYVSGGSSAGSAVAVAAGLASFALGTDTAGSGRVPAAFNNIVGLKPSRGLLSNRGVVPACRSLDCVSIFALSAADAAQVLDVAKGYDEHDPFSRREQASATTERPRFGIPRADQLEFFGNSGARALFEATVPRLAALADGPVEIDMAPFLEAARLLYEGPWVAERYAALRPFIESRPEALHPVTREIIEGGAAPSAADAFAAYYRLKEIKRLTEPVWEQVDMLLTPTAGTIYSIAEVEADPIRLNANLGYYTNFMNMLDLAGIAVPAGLLPGGLPFGVTLAARAFREHMLWRAGAAMHRAAGVKLGATGHDHPTGDR